MRTAAAYGCFLHWKKFPALHAQDVPAAPKVNAICTPPSGFELTTGLLGGRRYCASYVRALSGLVPRHDYNFIDYP